MHVCYVPLALLRKNVMQQLPIIGEIKRSRDVFQIAEHIGSEKRALDRFFRRLLVNLVNLDVLHGIKGPRSVPYLAGVRRAPTRRKRSYPNFGAKRFPLSPGYSSVWRKRFSHISRGIEAKA
jgi:hypothetical protein